MKQQDSATCLYSHKPLRIPGTVNMLTENRNIKLIIAYDGSEFSGWQRQLHVTTIQGEIERCLCQITQEKVSLHGAGRTDAGVHAEGMVAHFVTATSTSCDGFLCGLNSMLCTAIRILTVSETSSDFHARFAATGKHYIYSVFTGRIHLPNQRLYALHVTAKLHLDTIRYCLRLLEGSHDFSSFENTGSRDKNKTSGRGAVRTIYRAACIEKDSDILEFHFIGDGFLRHMVRNMMGTILETGKGKYSVTEFNNILTAKDRSLAGTTAPAHGLTLKEVFYQNPLRICPQITS